LKLQKATVGLSKGRGKKASSAKEPAFNAPDGTWQEFNEAVGSGKVVSTEIVSTDTLSPGQGFERIRNAFFRGEGLGRG
jgi:hypothetical protein